jgi:hypothetical protein
MATKILVIIIVGFPHNTYYFIKCQKVIISDQQNIKIKIYVFLIISFLLILIEVSTSVQHV